jgi:hypothetical protein
MFQHYIITRFNLRRSDWQLAKNNEKVLSDVWLKERFELFENFCFTSVKNQLNQNFKWLVFFDTNTPEKFKLKIKDLEKDFANFTPFFIDGMNSFLPSIIEKVNELDNEKFVISSRLDNDDCLHENYVNVVQSCFNNQSYMAIDLIDGLGMQVNEKVRIGKMRHLFNPYISLIEKKENCKTVWHKGHTFWKYENRITSISNQPMWLTIIHKRNKSNKFRGYGVVEPSILKEFNIKPSKLKTLVENVESNEFWRLMSFKNKLYLYTAYCSKKIKRIIGFYNVKIKFEKNKND